MEAKKGPKLIVNVTLIAEGKALLVKYKDMPDHQKGWFVPHEMLAFGEHPDTAAERNRIPQNLPAALHHNIASERYSSIGYSTVYLNFMSETYRTVHRCSGFDHNALSNRGLSDSRHSGHEQKAEYETEVYLPLFHETPRF